MEWKDMPKKAYYEKYERVDVKNDGGWYEVYRLPGRVFVIAEPRHVQETHFFLITGSERALLFDTGLGIVPVKPLIEELYQGELITVNSHFHFDHIGNNHCFEPVYGYIDACASKVAAAGLRRADVGDQMDEAMFKEGYPDGFDPERYEVLPYATKSVEDGHVFDLGDRSLRVIHTPGHSFDGLSLYDEKNKILFTGDTFYMGALYAQFHCDLFGYSDIKQYCETMTRLSREMPEDVRLYCSHEEFIAPSSKLGEAAELLGEIVKAGTDGSEKIAGGEHQYLDAESVLCEREGDGFSVVYVAED